MTSGASRSMRSTRAGNSRISTSVTWRISRISMTRSSSRARLADQRVARRLLRRVDADRPAMRVGEVPAQHAHAAGAAGAALAAVRQVEVLAERRGEHGLVGARLEFPVRWQQPDFHGDHYGRKKKGPASFDAGPQVSRVLSWRWAARRDRGHIRPTCSPCVRACLVGKAEMDAVADTNVHHLRHDRREAAVVPRLLDGMRIGGRDFDGMLSVPKKSAAARIAQP